MRWSAEALTDDNKAWLRQLPRTIRLTLGGRSIFLFHGSPLKENEYLWASRPSRVLARIASDEADDLFCFGHTHEAFHRVVGQAHFVACGSVGCGTDGDARARYAVMYIGEPDIAVGFRSVDYDHVSVVRDMAAVGRSIDLLREPPAAHPHVSAEASQAYCSAAGRGARSRRRVRRGGTRSALALLSLVRAADRRGSEGTADHAGEDDDRDQVRHRAVELCRDAGQEVAQRTLWRAEAH